MPIVVDASVVLASVLEEVPLAINLPFSVLEQDEWIVPGVWWFEVRNGLIVNERRGRISESLSAAFLRQLLRIATTVDTAPDGDRLMALARRHRLTVYDAAYLELAIREGLPLATLDTALTRAARSEAVPLVGAGDG